MRDESNYTLSFEGEPGELAILLFAGGWSPVYLAPFQGVLVPDQPISFGVTEFCRSCDRCSAACPASAIPAGGPVPVALAKVVPVVPVRAAEAFVPVVRAKGIAPVLAAPVRADSLDALGDNLLVTH